MTDNKRQLKFIGIDFWNRAQFKDENGFYFGNVDILFDYNTPGEVVLEKLTEDMICYFGDEPDCDPDGRKIKPDRIKLLPYD